MQAMACLSRSAKAGLGKIRLLFNCATMDREVWIEARMYSEFGDFSDDSIKLDLLINALPVKRCEEKLE